MRSSSKLLLLLGLSAILFSSCGGDEPPVPKKEMQLSFGYDSLVFSGYQPLQTKPVKVFYYIPYVDNVRDLPILFLFHGAERNGRIAISNWKSIAEDRKIILVAPNFTSELYPSIDYQFGGVSYSSVTYKAKPEETWTYQIVEPIFSYIKEKTGNVSKTYDMSGHSAGGQWVHRYLLFMKNARVRKAVEQNAGNYTVPDPNGITDGTNWFGFPYSIRDVDVITRDHLAAYFARDMIVHVGTLDTASSRAVDSYFPDDAGSMAEGRCRFERGHFFYNRAKRVADSLGLPFKWRIVEVPGVGHNSNRMVNDALYGAGTLLYYSD